jgi:hypothetical protein
VSLVTRADPSGLILGEGENFNSRRHIETCPVPVHGAKLSLSLEVSYTDLRFTFCRGIVNVRPGATTDSTAFQFSSQSFVWTLYKASSNRVTNNPESAIT